jgi:hypothetical protein
MHYLILISLLLISFLGLSQTEVTWEDLEIKTFNEVYSEKYNAYYMEPIFNEKAQKLNGKKIVIMGFITPLDKLSDYYILSNEVHVPSCEEILRSEVLIDLRIKLDSTQNLSEEVKIKGVLRTNKDDLHRTNYILENAKIITNK